MCDRQTLAMASLNHGITDLRHRDPALRAQQRRRAAAGERHVPTRCAVHAGHSSGGWR